MVKLSKLRKLAAVLLLTVCLPVSAQYVTEKDIPYVPDDTSSYRQERCRLDVYCPKEKSGFKTLIWFHGGGLEGGDKCIPEELAEKGFAVVAPNYRLFPRCRYPDYLDDAADAVAWTLRHISDYGGSPTEIYVGGHSAGGYLTLMLALDKDILFRHGVDADSLKGYYPVSGQTATHFTIRKERGISFDLPVVDAAAPLNHARFLKPRLLLFTGYRDLEMMARYEENLYLKAVMEGVGNSEIPLYELKGFDHGTVVAPAALLIARELSGR